MSYRWEARSTTPGDYRWTEAAIALLVDSAPPVVPPVAPPAPAAPSGGIDKQHKTIEPGGDLIELTMLDGTKELYTVQEAIALKKQGKLAPAGVSTALTEEDVYGDDLL